MTYLIKGFTTLFRDTKIKSKIHLFFYPGYNEQWKPILSLNMTTNKYTFVIYSDKSIEYIFDDKETSEIKFNIKNLDNSEIKYFSINVTDIE